MGHLPDRLVSELRLAGARTLEEANRVLRDFLPRYNQEFAVPAAQSGSAYRRPGEGFIPDEVFCFKYHRTVGLDNVVRFDELPIPGITAKETLELKAPHCPKPGPDHPWRRPFKVHLDRGVTNSLNN